MKILRAYWTDIINDPKWINKVEIPRYALHRNEVVYTWDMGSIEYFTSGGYEVRYVEDDRFNDISTVFGRKLIALDLGLKEFGEAMLLDWDCSILRPLDEKFFSYLEEKNTQVPLYGLNIQGLKEVDGDDRDDQFFADMERNLKKYSYMLDQIQGTINRLTPNFGCVYSRDGNFGKDLIDIALSEKLYGCVEEHAMFLYARHMHGVRTKEEYIEKFQPRFVHGVSDDNLTENLIGRCQWRANRFIEHNINMDLYLKHI